MMTIKIVSKETDGQERVHLFPAERIDYMIQRLNPPLDYRSDKQLPFKTVDDVLAVDNPQFVVSGLSNYAVNQNMEVAWVSLYDVDGGIATMFITAPATCYVLSEGKTIDRFYLCFLE